MTEIRTDARITFTNEEMFTAEEIQFLRLATAALEWMGKQEMQEEDHTETAEMVIANAPVVMRKLNRLLNDELIETSGDIIATRAANGEITERCQYCGTTIHGMAADIDSGMRHHLEYCDVYQLIPEPPF